MGKIPLYLPCIVSLVVIFTSCKPIKSNDVIDFTGLQKKKSHYQVSIVIMTKKILFVHFQFKYLFDLIRFINGKIMVIMVTTGLPNIDSLIIGTSNIKKVVSIILSSQIQFIS